MSKDSGSVFCDMPYETDIMSRSGLVRTVLQFSSFYGKYIQQKKVMLHQIGNKIFIWRGMLLYITNLLNKHHFKIEHVVTFIQWDQLYNDIILNTFYMSSFEQLVPPFFVVISPKKTEGFLHAVLK